MAAQPHSPITGELREHDAECSGAGLLSDTAIVSDAPAAHVEELRAHYVQVEFTVAADGSVQDARLVDRDANERYAPEILHAVREARFRPKLVDAPAGRGAGNNLSRSVLDGRLARMTLTSRSSSMGSRRRRPLQFT